MTLVEAHSDGEGVPEPAASPAGTQSRLSRWSIGKRIQVLMILGVMALVATNIVHVANWYLEVAGAKKLSELDALRETTRVLEANILRIESAAQAFVGSNEREAAERFSVAMAAALEEADALSQAEQMAIGDIAGRLTSTLSSVNAAFAEVRETAFALGMSDDEGLRKRMLTSVGAVEEEMTRWPNTVFDVINALQRMRRYEAEYLLNGSRAALGQHRKAFNEFDFAIDGTTMAADEKGRLRELVNVYRQDFVTLTDKLSELNDQLSNEETGLRPRLQSLFPVLNDVISISAAEADRVSQERGEEQAVSLGVIILALLFFASLKIGRSVREPISDIAMAMRALYEGSLNTQVPGLDRLDEIGDMARAIEMFKKTATEVDTIKAEEALERERRAALAQLALDFERQIKDAAVSVSRTAEELRSTAGEMAASARSSQDIGTNAEAMAGNTLRNVSNVVEVTQELIRSGNLLSERFSRSSAALADVMQEMETSRQRMRSLSEAADRIGNVVDLINDIASQTNLLALNATIEAARAGEAGRGFSVVANEVKALAMQTTNAIGEISGHVERIRSEVGTTVDSIVGVSGQLSGINEMSAAVFAALEDQASATRRIGENVDTAADGTNAIAKTISEVSHSLQAMGNTAEHMLQASGMLSDLASNLSGEADAFLSKVKLG